MKSFLSVLLVLSTLAVFSNGQLINDQLRGALENFRDNMPCMDPPLAPLAVEYVDINVDVEGSLELHGFAEDIIIRNLNTFIVEHINFNLIGLRIQFILTLEDLPITGFYNLNGRASGAFPFHGNGSFTAIPQLITLAGELQLNTVNGFLNMRSFDSVLTVEGMHCNFENLISENGMTQDFLNRVLENMVLEIVVQQRELITATIEGIVLPRANAVLNTMTLSDLLDAIAGGSGEPSEPCIPPEETVAV